MKDRRILFLNRGVDDLSDYLVDSLFIGLRKIFGSNLIDYPKINRMYEGFFYNDGGRHIKEEFYGKGFTLYGYMNDIIVDRTDIELKIKAKFFVNHIFLRTLEIKLKH